MPISLPYGAYPRKRLFTLHGSRGGGISIAFLGMSIILLIMLVFVNIVDYSLYSAKRNMIARAVDYSVSAAVQEVDPGRSSEGLALEYDGESGIPSVDSIFLDEEKADNAFFSTLDANAGIGEEDIEPYVMRIIASPQGGTLECRFKKGSLQAVRVLSDPQQLEAAINSQLTVWNDGSGSSDDSHMIYVNGNPRTVEFKSRPYYMAVIRDYEIDGLFRRRTATFVGFAGARIERRE